jgi:hypothetical protein
MAAKKEKSNHSAETLDLYDKLIAVAPGIERKGATMPYTSLNGNMFSFLNKNGELCMRLSEADRNEFMKKYKADLCIEYGTVLKEYVSVPAGLFRTTKELKPWFKLSHQYVKTLKTKPARKK